MRPDAIEPASATRRHWPPAVTTYGAEPSLSVILSILAAATWLTHVLGALIPRQAAPLDAATGLALVAGLRLAVWLAALAALNWWRPAGFGRGGASPWGVVPLVALTLAVVLRGWPVDDAYGISFTLVLAANTALGALREEIVFRGFLFHGLSARLGGAAAVVVGSALFALSHVPRYVGEERAAADIVALLIVVFCLGVLLCRIRAATGSIWLPAAIHTLWNLAAGTGAVVAATPTPVTFAYAAPFALGAALFVALALPRLWPRAFATIGTVPVVGSMRSRPPAVS